MQLSRLHDAVQILQRADEMKLTDWYEYWQSPVRDGVYAREPNVKGLWYAVFSSGRWFVGSSSIEGALVNFREHRVSNMRISRWRGIAK